MNSIKDSIISNSEFENQYFLENTSDYFSFAKNVNALLNSNGGEIYLGINQKNKVIGIFPDFELEEIKKIIKYHFVEEISFSSEVIEVDFKLVLKLSFKESLIKPQYIKILKNKELYLIKRGEIIKGNHIIEKMLKFKSLNGGRPIVFSKNEMDLNKIIEVNSNISLNRLYKMTNFPKKSVDFVLVRLLNWEMIDYKISEGSCYFYSI